RPTERRAGPIDDRATGAVAAFRRLEHRRREAVDRARGPGHLLQERLRRALTGEGRQRFGERRRWAELGECLRDRADPLLRHVGAAAEVAEQAPLPQRSELLAAWVAAGSDGAR